MTISRQGSSAAIVSLLKPSDFRLARPNGVEGVFQKRLQPRNLGGFSIRPRHEEILQRRLARFALPAHGRQRKGILGDDLEFRILEHRQAFREGDELAAYEQLQMQRVGRIFAASIDMGRKRAAGRRAIHHRLDVSDIFDRFFGREAVAIAHRKGTRVAARHAFRDAFICPRCVLKAVFPGANGGPDFRFQFFDVGVGARARIASDDIMHARQRLIVEHRRRRRLAPVERAREIP